MEFPFHSLVLTPYPLSSSLPSAPHYDVIAWLCPVAFASAAAAGVDAGALAFLSVTWTPVWLFTGQLLDQLTRPAVSDPRGVVVICSQKTGTSVVVRNSFYYFPTSSSTTCILCTTTRLSSLSESVSEMASTAELVSTLSLRCNEHLHESPSTSSSHVVGERSRRRSNRIVLGSVNNNTNRSSHIGTRKRQSNDNHLNYPHCPSVGTLPDRAIVCDGRVLQNLKMHESFLAVNSHYFSSIQEHIRPYHREQAVEWLTDVAKEERCDVDILPLAVSIMDRFLSVQNIFKDGLQAVAGVCLFIASKLKAPLPLNADRVAYYTAESVTSNEILSWELMVLNVLEWDLSAPTAFDFFDQMIWAPGVSTLRETFTTVVHKIQKNAKLGMLPPSMQCALSLLQAAAMLDQGIVEELVKTIPIGLGVDPVLVRGLLPQMERAVTGQQWNPISPQAPPSSCRTPSPQQQQQLTALKPSTGLATPMNDSGFCSGASSPESACKKEMDCSPPKAPRLSQV